MEEVEDIIPEEIPEAPPSEAPPEPLPLKRANKLTEKNACEGCGKQLSLHAYKYSHKCKARAPDDPVPEPKEKSEHGKAGGESERC